jgi:hypothetical protein
MAGSQNPIAPARRGVELSAFVKSVEWLTRDADYAWSHAYFIEFDTVRDRVPNAVNRVISLGVRLAHPHGWFGGARFR